MVRKTMLLGVLALGLAVSALLAGKAQAQEDWLIVAEQEQLQSLGRENKPLMPATLAMAQRTGARYFSTYKAASAFARSIAATHHTSITRSRSLYRVEYWAKGSHG